MRNGLAAPTRSEVVSSDDEPLILVDSRDRELGYLDKSACHDGEGRLHRAFSVFIFNPRGDVLLQRRSRSKRLWPSHWSNSCCSHPRKGETMEQAVHRRIRQELGFAAADLERNSFIGDVAIRFDGKLRPSCPLRFSDNSMDVLTLPVPGQEGPEEYDRKTLHFEQIGVREFELTIGRPAAVRRWKQRSASIAGGFSMKGARRWGVY